jgi:hypothetical protein
MGTICSSALLWCLVDLNVLDNEVSGVQSLGFGIGFGVLEKINEKFARLDGPAGLGDAKRLSCIQTQLTTDSHYAIDQIDCSTTMAQARTHPVRYDQCFQHISSLARLPCAP